MSKLLSILCLLLWASCAEGSIAFDAFTSSGQITGDISFDHTPVGTPKGVLVYVIMTGASISVTSVTYGGAALTETADSPVSNVTGELGSTHCYFLGSSIPSGMQTVAVDVLLGTEVSIAGVITLTADQDTSVVDTGFVLSDTTSATTTTLALGGVSSFCATGFWSGLNQVSNYTPLTGWTERAENDYGNTGAGIYTYDTVSTVDVTAGYTPSGSDDCAMHAIAVRENAAAGGDRRAILIS